MIWTPTRLSEDSGAWGPFYVSWWNGLLVTLFTPAGDISVYVTRRALRLFWDPGDPPEGPGPEPESTARCVFQLGRGWRFPKPEGG